MRNNQILSTALNGRAITPRADPSSIVQLPWNNLTLTFSASSSAALTVSNVLSALQVIFTSESKYQIQIKSARLWETTGVPIACAFNSLDASNPGTLKHQDDFQARNQWARVGYIWPRSHQNLILNNSSAAELPVLQVTAGSNAVIVLHLEITWKPIVTPGPTSAVFKSVSSLQPQHPAEPEHELYRSTNFEFDTIPCSFPEVPLTGSTFDEQLTPSEFYLDEVAPPAAAGEWTELSAQP
jgi:hypothetical protein